MIYNAETPGCSWLCLNDAKY